MDLLEQIISQTEAEPVATINGKNVYDFENAQKVNKRRLAEEKISGKHVELGEREVTDGGMHYTHSKADTVAINPENYFLNRARKVKKSNGNTAYEIVTDYRAIKEQSTGRIYTNNITAYVIGMHGRGITLIETTKISDKDFVNDFKQSLSHADMARVIEAISRNIEKTNDELSLDFED